MARKLKVFIPEEKAGDYTSSHSYKSLGCIPLSYSLSEIVKKGFLLQGRCMLQSSARCVQSLSSQQVCCRLGKTSAAFGGQGGFPPKTCETSLFTICVYNVQ